MALFAACGGGDNETPTIAASVSTSTVSPAGTATSVALPTSQATTPPTTGNVSGQGNRLAIDMGIAGKTGNILDTAVFPPIEEENVRYGGILVLPNQFSDSMDPKRSQNSISRDTIWEYQKLLSWRPNPDDTLIHLEPELAES